MNTVWADRSGRYDDLADVDDLRAWLAANGAPAEAVDEAHLARFRTLRDALRRLAAFRTGDDRERAASPTVDVAQAISDVNEAATLAPAGDLLDVVEGELRLKAAEGDAVNRRLSVIAAQSIEFLAGPEGSKLRPCLAPVCVLYFTKDHPRREWCSPGCGNRARVARHYARHKEER